MGAAHMDVLAQVQDIESSALELAQDLKYPVDVQGHVVFVNYLHPDLMPCLVYHLIRCGWRKDPDKQLIKQRQVVGSQFTDLVAYVPLEETDDPIHADPPKPDEGWSVRPVVNVIDEERPE